MEKINIITKQFTVQATLKDSSTANAFYDLLPLEKRANKWGDELYFEIPLNMPEENPKAIVPSGTIAYWPVGNAFCIFFGQTPASPVNVIGFLDSDPDSFKQVRNGEHIRLEKIEKED